MSAERGFRQSAFAQETHLAYRLAEGVAPDLQLKYGVKWFAPERVRISLWRDDASPEWAIEAITADGPQRLKGGGLSEVARLSRAWHVYGPDVDGCDQRPDWLRPLIAEALATARQSSA